MRTIGIIPARGGSKGIPKKNIKSLNGKPLIAYTIQAAMRSTIDRVIVSTDCEVIASVAQEFGAEVVIRPTELAKDSSPTLPVLQHIMKNINETFDAVVTLQPTSPLRCAKHINEAIELFKNDYKADSLVSVIAVPHNYAPEKIMKINGRYLTGNSKAKRRQEINTVYARNGAAIYITRACKLDEYIFGGNILPYIMSKLSSIDVDDLEDWELVSLVMRHKLND